MTRRRELSDAAVYEQALQLAAYSSKGGAVSRWLDTKDFLPADRDAILKAFFRLDEEDAGEPEDRRAS